VQTSFTLTAAGTSFTKTVDDSDPYGLPLEVTYPAGETVTAARTEHGRLASMGVGSSTTSLISSVTYQGAELMQDVTLGSGLVRSDVYDHRKRLLQRTYTSSSGRTISDLRYVYDGANRETARQYVERAGQTDLFIYDDASRLERAELKARPASPLSEGSAPAWTMSPEHSGDWRPGSYGREYDFDGSGRDELVTVTTDPLGASPAPFAASLSYDAVGRLDGVDGFTPTYDALGNVTRAKLASPYGDATLAYDGLSRLRTVTFDDGTVVEYGYRPDGLPMERELTCGTSAPVTCADSHQVFVYDGLRLLEVYDVVSGTPQLSARYYYADEGEVPFAGDFDVSGTGTLARHFLVVDRQGSITGVLDAQNDWVERVSYDAYGHPLIEPSDAMAPEVSLVIDAGTSLEVAFSEEVFPAVAPASGDLVGVLGLAGAVEVRDSTGTLVSSSGVTYLDDFVHGNGRNTTVRVPLSSGLADGSYTLTVQPGFLTDDWGNDAAGSVSFSVSSGSLVFTGTSFGDTDVGAADTSAVGNVLFFQSHLWDADAGLLHMKARVLDPSTGHFLQRDPVAYQDALNLYAGYAWDPVNLRDPTGEFVCGGLCAAAVIGAGVAAYTLLGDLFFGSGRLRTNTEIVGGLAVGAAAGVAGAGAGGLTTAVIGNGARATLSGAAAALTGGVAGGTTARVLTAEELTWEGAALDAGTGLLAYGVLQGAGRLNPLRGDPFNTDDAVRGALDSFADDLAAPTSQSYAARGAGRLKSIGSGQWRSSAGLIYGQGSKHGNRVRHVLAHAAPDASKPAHSVFNVARNRVLGLVDEAWAARGSHTTHPSSGNWNYRVGMGRVIGTEGQTAINISVRPGTSEIITAFPVP
jgi:RHS repeat-associated protein